MSFINFREVGDTVEILGIPDRMVVKKVSNSSHLPFLFSRSESKLILVMDSPAKIVFQVELKVGNKFSKETWYDSILPALDEISKKIEGKAKNDKK